MGRLLRHQLDTEQTLLADEGRLRELISIGAPLSFVLDKISIALDLDVGNVVSVVLLSDNHEQYTDLIAQNAAVFGLSIFCTSAVLSPGGELLGTLEMYSSTLRSPTLGESKLIERATQLAALAIESHNHGRGSQSFPSLWKGSKEKDPPDVAPS